MKPVTYFGVFSIACFATVCANSNYLYGQRIAGGLPVYNDLLKIDGDPVEHFKNFRGDRVMLKCITGLRDYPIFAWYKNGKPLTKDFVKYQLISNGNSFLEIPALSLSSEGNYTCSVNNDFGLARKEYKICVIAPGIKEDCPGWWYNW